MVIRSFPPIVDERAKVLVLGSMPSVESLRKNENYGHPQNRFWPMMFRLFGREYSGDYEVKKALLKENGIALWDSIASCERPGSLDKDIKNDVPNDIEGLLKKYPNIRAIIFNGQKSYAVFKKHFGKRMDLPTYVMPSTSPIPRKTIRGMDDLIAHWGKIIELIKN